MASKERVRRVWTAGSYPDIGETLLSMAAHLVDAAAVDADERVLDVACGTGNVALENVDEDDRPALRADVIETIQDYFDGGKNAMAMDYRLAGAVVK